MVEGYAKCVKYLLFAFNLVFFLAGVVIFVTAIVVQSKVNDYSDFFGGNNAAVGLIVIGCIIMIISFYGCCGAYKENYCLVLTFGILLTIVLILEVIFVALIYAKRDEVTAHIDDDILLSLNKYKNSTAIQAAWDSAQVDFQCCGAKNYTDWKSVLKTDVPDSCCITLSNDCGSGLAVKKLDEVKSVIYTNGCIDNVEDYLSGNLVMLGGVGIGLIFIQVVGIALAATLAHYIRKEYQVM